MTRHTVVVTDHRFDDLSVEREGLGDLADVEALLEDPDERADQLARADALLNTLWTVDREAIDALSDCRVIARWGIGYDNIDVEAAADRKIPVVNVPDYCIEEVSTHAVAMILSNARRLKHYGAEVAAGGWKSEAVAPIEQRFSSSTVGVIGYGAIGQLVGERVAALGADVLASDPYLTPADVGEEATLVEREELLERADHVTVHSPLTDETRGLIDADALARMKDTATLVNAARGGIVDEEALVEALDSGEIVAAGIDTFEEEPPAPDHPLRDHPKVVATPHEAWYSAEADAERRESVVAAVRAALRGEQPPNVVNGVAVDG